jgi:hypothetical protein
VTRTSESTPARLVPDFCRYAQSSGECPGDKSTLPRAFGVLTVEPALDGSPRLPFEVGGPRFGSGPREGRGPVEGTRMDGEDEDDVGSARRFEGATRGGGMRDAVGLGDRAMGFSLLSGGMTLCAEFIAGNEGGGRLSSSSSSSELSCASRVKVGTAGASCACVGAALGVDSGDGLLGGTIVGGSSTGAMASVLLFCD